MQNAELLWSLVIRLGLGNWVNEVLFRVIILKKLTWKLIQSFSQPSPQAFFGSVIPGRYHELWRHREILITKLQSHSAFCKIPLPFPYPFIHYFVNWHEPSWGIPPPRPRDPRGQYHHWHDRIFLIWQAPAGYEEFAVGMKPIRNGEIFWMNQ